MKGRRTFLLGGACTLLFLGGSLRADVVRGDTNADGVLDLSDVIRLFEWLGVHGVDDICFNAADVNADGEVNITDAICILEHMYGTGDGLKPISDAIIDACMDHEEVFEMAEVGITVLSPVSAVVSWLTAHRSNTIVRYGLEETLTEGVDMKLIDEEAIRHEVLLRGLEPGLTYYYQAESIMPDGKVALSPLNRFSTLQIAPYTVRPDHPRLFFTREDIPVLASRIRDGGPDERSWDMVSDWCRANIGISMGDLAQRDNIPERIRAFAFVGLIGGSEGCRDKAIQAGKYLADISDPEDIRGYTEAIAYVYDWLHDALSGETKEKLLAALVRNARRLEGMTHDDEFVTGTSHGHTKSLVLAALAMHGDHDYAAVLLEDLVRDYRYGFLATWRRFAGSDGGSSKGWWYTSYTLPFELEFISAWRTATGQDLFQEERVWVEPMLDWFLFGLRGDYSFLREGDARGFKGMILENRIFGNMLGREYGNANAQWLADRVNDAEPLWGPHGMVDLLWRDPALEAVPPSGSTSKIFRNTGTAIMRSSWSLDAAMAAFRSAEVYTAGHTHRDNCSFTVFYKEPLAIDSGIYDDYSTSHHDNYYSRTVAHNCITVFDPDEDFYRYDDKFSNDGGQRWLGEDEVDHPWPPTAEDTVERSDGYLMGGMPRYEEGEGFTYALGNGTPSYSRRKMKKFLRHFLWLGKVEGWDHPVILVFDDVITTQAEFPKSYLLHMESEPEITGPLVKVRNGSATLQQVTLFPMDAQINLIGGPGKEYWVNGENYPPRSEVKPKDEPGAWRVEVSPPPERTDERFLHALFIGDEDAPSPPEATTFVAGWMQGCQVGDWTVLFDYGGPLEDVEYDSSLSRQSHLIFGAVPLATYEVYLDGAFYKSVQASFSGTLRLETHFATHVRVVRGATG